MPPPTQAAAEPGREGDRAGHPRTVNGLRVVAEVFAERGIDPTADPTEEV